MTNGRFASLLRRVLLGALPILLASAALPVPASAYPTIVFKISGGGWGHGIGMSQYGAKGYAGKTNPATGRGYTYAWMLNHYYQGTALKSAPKSPTVKVNLERNAYSRSQWWVASGADTTLTVAQESSTSVKVALPKTKTYWITTAGSNTEIRDDQTYKDSKGVTQHRPNRDASYKPIKVFSGACIVAAGSSSTTSRVLMKSTSGPQAWSNVTWRGTIHFQPTTATTAKAVNYVWIEQYLYGVVPREMPSSWATEALRTQAVAARSYAYQDAVDGKTLYCTTRSQVYNGYSSSSHGLHEAASTNKAVDDTRGKLVWYGSETRPVKTYFFSSSGGRTANIEDVWVGSSPMPYYKSVSDADQGNPYYRWTYGPQMTSQFSPLVRSYVGSALSAPFPAVIQNIWLEQPSSRYARYAWVTWSNGVTYKIKGDQLRGALGLRSTHFGLSTRHDDTSGAISKTGTWATHYTSTTDKSDNKQYLISRTKGSTATLKFSGSSVKWIGIKTDHYGKADVLIDGVLAGTVDLYSATTKYKQTLFTKSGLKAGAHTIALKVRGDKQRVSKDTWITIDAYDVVGGLPPQ